MVSPAGDALSWPSLDVDVYVPGLVERAFGSRLFAAATGRRGQRTRSPRRLRQRPTSLTACYLPAYRAGRIDPMQALREE